MVDMVSHLRGITSGVLATELHRSFSGTCNKCVTQLTKVNVSFNTYTVLYRVLLMCFINVYLCALLMS